MCFIQIEPNLIQRVYDTYLVTLNISVSELTKSAREHTLKTPGTPNMHVLAVNVLERTAAPTVQRAFDKICGCLEALSSR